MTYPPQQPQPAAPAAAYQHFQQPTVVYVPTSPPLPFGWQFQVWIHRALTPYEGQRMIEQTLRHKAGPDRFGDPNVCKLPGVNIYSNQFPQWFQDLIEQHFEYMDYNHYYMVDCDRKVAKAWDKWVHALLRNFMGWPNADRIYTRIISKEEEAKYLEDL